MHRKLKPKSENKAGIHNVVIEDSFSDDFQRNLIQKAMIASLAMCVRNERISNPKSIEDFGPFVC